MKRILHNKLDLDDTLSQSGAAGRDLFGKQLLAKRLSGGPMVGMVILFLIVFVAYSVRLFSLVSDPLNNYEKILYRNRLNGTIVSAPRGIIVDRNGQPIAQSIRDSETGNYMREVADIPGIGNLIGFIRYPQKDSSGYYWRFTTEGVSGLEKLYNKKLTETPGYRYTSSNKSKESTQVSEEKILYPREGAKLQITLDKDLTTQIGMALAEYIEEYNFDGGAALVADIQTGELLSEVSLPDIDPDSLSRGDPGVAAGYLKDPHHPLLNRAVFGGFSPGSTVKPYMVLAFLANGIIQPDSKILSTGKIVIQNPYDDSVKYTFRDWKPGGHGWTDARLALAESVNSFFYIYSGGYESTPGLGIMKMKSFMHTFGLGDPVVFPLSGTQPGQVPEPSWKKKTFNEAWRLGDTYNSAIGQYGFTVTPLQQLRAVMAIASRGSLIDPVLIQGDTPKVRIITGIKPEWYDVVHGGMRDVVTKGTAQILDIPELHIAAKSGTAQVSNKTKINSWVIGFWPYEHPRYAFVLLAENGPKEGAPNVSRALRPVLDWMITSGKYTK